MLSAQLYSEFCKAAHPADPRTRLNPLRADTYKWTAHDINPEALMSENMLAKEIATSTSERQKTGHRSDVRTYTAVYLCYNWKLKTEFILVKSTQEETASCYTPQYGRDDNHESYTQRHFQLHAYSVEAFQREQPALAPCLQVV